MKKLFVLLTLSVAVLSCCTGAGKYRIKDSDGNNHYTDTYTVNAANCVEFTEKDGNDKLQPVIICGSYTIIRQNQEEK